MRTLMSGGPRHGERMDWPGFSAEQPPVCLELLAPRPEPAIADYLPSFADGEPGEPVIPRRTVVYQRTARGLCGAWMYRFTP